MEVGIVLLAHVSFLLLNNTWEGYPKPLIPKFMMKMDEKQAPYLIQGESGMAAAVVLVLC